MPKAQHAQRYRYLPALLRQLRTDAEMTQRDLAKKLRVSHVFVHKSEIGERRVDVTEYGAGFYLRRRALPVGLTQRRVAEAVGREQNFISRIETGQPRVDLLEFVIICRACDGDVGSETASLVKKIVRRRKSS
jgi:transcriptional regulator with XRE-family HTH domain